MTDAVSCLCHQDLARVVRLRSGLELLKCRACGLYARLHQPDPEALSGHYRDDYWNHYAAEQATEARANLFRHVLTRVEERRGSRGDLVDIGCGAGNLLQQATELGWRATGIEPSEQAAGIGRAAGLDVRVAAWPATSWPAESSDAVVFLNVLDHLHDPMGALEAAWKTLRSGGVLYIRVPNGPLHVRLLACAWPAALARLSVFHLYGFGARALKHLLARTGFEDVDIRTAPLSQQDAYARNEHGLLRRLAKSCLSTGYTLSAVVGLDRCPWGPSLEATAVKSPS